MPAYIVMNPYIPQTDFSDDEDNGVGGRSTLDNSSLDAEFAALVTVTDAFKHNLELIQRSDGKLEDLLVEPQNLSKALLTLMSVNVNARGAWATATAYKINDLVKENGVTYVAVEDHTSGVFLTDLAQLKWIDFGDLTAEEIKIAYESNADTNAFDDAALAKLAAIEALADVTDADNVNAAGAVMESDYANNTLRYKNNAGVMANTTLINQTVVVRDQIILVEEIPIADQRGVSVHGRASRGHICVIGNIGVIFDIYI